MKNNHLVFNKMHGLGNDFAVVNALSTPINLSTRLIAHYAQRHTGIGYDQFLVIEPSDHADFYCRIYNADGSEAEQCGNGLRCVARFIHEEGLSTNKHFIIETKTGLHAIDIEDYKHIRVNMGVPIIQNNLLAIKIPAHANEIALSVLSMGNPHGIIKVHDLENPTYPTLAKELGGLDLFPNGANIGFMQIKTRNHIRLRTFERGSGETFSCGSNACAATASGIVNGWLEHSVKVEFAYGSLSIDWEGDTFPLYLTGPAEKVYEGIISRPYQD